MDILPDDIQDTIYKYKHQMEYRNVMEELKVSVCYCGWCGDKQWIWTDCDCWQARGMMILNSSPPSRKTSRPGMASSNS